MGAGVGVGKRQMSKFDRGEVDAKAEDMGPI